MNFKCRIKGIEKKLKVHGRELKFSDILRPEYIYKGKSFDKFDEMLLRLNITDVPHKISNEEIQILLEKRILSVVSIVTLGSFEDFLIHLIERV